MVSTVRAAAALALAAAAAGAPPAYAACADLDPQEAVVSRNMRPVTPEDLARLRDIGAADSSNLSGETPLALSPDGRKLAFVLTRPEPDTNTICRGVFVIEPARPDALRIIDSGGEPILQDGGYRGLRVVTGMPATIRPQWSPDGRRAAYLRREQGVTQVWLADADGTQARQVTFGSGDVTRFAWSNDGSRIVYARRLSSAALRQADMREALQGYRYDERFVPTRGFGPQPSAKTAEDVISLSPGSADERPANPDEIAFLAKGSGTRVGLAADALPLLPIRPRMEVGGKDHVCRAETCTGAVAVFEGANANEALFLRRERPARDVLALYRWTLGVPEPTRLWSTGQTLLGCVRWDERLICLSENARSPSRIVAIDIATGKSRTLFDPNPEFARIRLPRVERLVWKNDRGLTARGDLVLPSGPRPAAGWPLVVAQYDSDGFLRGGTGNENPIFAFAERGIAVLSLDQPPPVAVLEPRLPDWDAVNAYNARGWAERRSLLSALELGVRLAVRRGANPAAVGLTGLSDGATTVAYALINAGPIAAASISTCCIEPLAATVLGGPGYARQMRRQGAPPAGVHDPGYWAPISLVQNAAHITAPLLMQLGEDEYLLGLPTYQALQQQGRAVELYVFAGEHHVKWQPAHRLAIYRRNLDWFDFWLRGVEDPDPGKSDQYRRWRAMRVPPVSPD